MSFKPSNFNRESICVTCLSQDRKLFSVSASEMCAKFYFELSLKWTDKICWECYYTVKKMVAFKNKAQAAQAWLRSAKNKQNEVQSLSTLSKSTGIFLTIIGPNSTTETTAPEPLAIVNVKQEMDFDESIDSTVIETVFKKEFDGPIDGVVKAECMEAKGEKRREEQGPSNIAKRKAFSTTPVKQPDAYTEAISTDKQMKKPRYNTNEVLVSPLAKRKANSTTPGKQTNLYTETIMTEEQMTEWRVKKRDSKFFQQSIPSERCDTCIQPLERLVDVKTHAVRHTELYGLFVCNVCQQRALDEKQLEFHKRQHYRLLQCSYCEFSWDHANSMRQHCSDVHQIKQTTWECDECGHQLHSSKRFWNHTRNHRVMKCPQTIKKRRLVKASRPKVQCKECGKYYPKISINAHMRTHNTEVDPAAYCKECGVQFRDMLLYKAHMSRNKHADESQFRFQCDKCPKKFVKNAELRKHSLIHAENRTEYPCDQCDQSFKQQPSLLRHKQKIHEGKEPPRDKLCDYCGKGFWDKNTLADHLNTHTGARPFVCKLCGADFRHKSALYLHGRYKHKIQKKNTNKSTKTKETPKSLEDTNSNEKDSCS